MKLTAHATSALAILLLTGLAQATEIKLSEPADGATLHLLTPLQREFLASFEKRGEKPPRPAGTEDNQWYDFYIPNDFTKPVVEASKKEEYHPLSWTVDGGVTNVRVVCSPKADFSEPIVKELAGKREGNGKTAKFVYPAATLPDLLLLDTQYWWKVEAEDSETGKTVSSDVRTFVTSGQLPRLMRQGLFGNCRDMGGGVNADGRRVRQGLLYRAAAPWLAKYCPPEMVKRVVDKSLGLKTELDLRSEGERDERSARYGEVKPEELSGLHHVFAPIYPYHLRHPENIESLRVMFATLADKNNYPLLFNCKVGSDRTGTLAFLLGAVLGRTDEQIIDDYEFTSILSQNNQRYRYARKAGELFDYDHIPTPYREHVDAYLLSIGVPQEQIDAIREIMLEPARP